MLVPELFTHFSDAVSLSQSRRAAASCRSRSPSPAGSRSLARPCCSLPLALVAGIVCSGCGRATSSTGSATAARRSRRGSRWSAAPAALVLGLARPAAAACRERYGLGAAAMACFVLPVLVHGFRHWSPASADDPARALARARPRAANEGAAGRGRARAGRRRATASSPRRRCTSSPRRSTHVANTKANDPYGRARAVRHWVAARTTRASRGATARPGRSATVVSIVSRGDESRAAAERDAAVVAGFVALRGLADARWSSRARRHRALPGFPRYRYNPLAGDAYGYYFGAREILDTWRRDGRLVLPSRSSPCRGARRWFSGARPELSGARGVRAIGFVAAVLVEPFASPGRRRSAGRSSGACRCCRTAPSACRSIRTSRSGSGLSALLACNAVTSSRRTSWR